MMKAVRFHGQRDIRVEEVPIPKCGKGQVKVRKLSRFKSQLAHGPSAQASVRWHLWFRYDIVALGNLVVT